MPSLKPQGQGLFKFYIIIQCQERCYLKSCYFWNYKVKVYSNFTSLFSVMKDNSCVFFSLNLNILWTKWAHWSEIFDLLFHNGHKEFDKFWLVHSKVSKICTLMGCFRPKYMFELKKIQRSYLSWYWEVMQNLERSWIVSSKLTWRI